MSAAVAACFLLLLSSCSGQEGTIHFVGDSIVKGWDTDRCFSSFLTFNHGVNGARLEDCRAWGIDCSGSLAVVLVGTNNLSQGYRSGRLTDEFIAGFTDSYVRLIQELNADRCYAVSILPRNLVGKMANLNSEIERLNEALEDALRPLSPKVVFVDAYPKFFYKGGLNPDYTIDDLHLNDSGYKVLSRELKRLL